MRGLIIILLLLLTSCAVCSGVAAIAAVSGVAIEAKRLDSEGEDRIVNKVVKMLQSNNIHHTGGNTGMPGGGKSVGLTIRGVLPARVNSPPEMYDVYVLPSIGIALTSYS